jgi:hypothetical protein
LRRKDCPHELDTLDEDNLLMRWDDSEGDKASERSEGDIYAYKIKNKVLIGVSVSCQK